MTNKKSFADIAAATPAAVSFFSEEVIKKVDGPEAVEKKAAQEYVPEPVKPVSPVMEEPKPAKTARVRTPSTRKAREQRSKRMSLFVSPTMYEAVNAAAADMDLSTNSYINLVLKMALESKSKDADN